MNALAARTARSLLWFAILTPAEQCDVVGVDNGKQNHPTHIRTECRKAGYAWAGKTEHEIAAATKLSVADVRRILTR